MKFVVTKNYQWKFGSIETVKSCQKFSQFSKIKLPCSGLYRGASQRQSVVNLLMQVHILSVYYLHLDQCDFGVMVNG